MNKFPSVNIVLNADKDGWFLLAQCDVHKKYLESVGIVDGTETLKCPIGECPREHYQEAYMEAFRKRVRCGKISNARIMDKYLKEAREYFSRLSAEELKAVLTEAGFEVQEGSGKIIRV